MEKKLNIYFTTDNKKTYHITLSFPKDDLSKATVEAVAKKLLIQKYLTTTNTLLQGSKKLLTLLVK